MQQDSWEIVELGGEQHVLSAMINKGGIDTPVTVRDITKECKGTLEMTSESDEILRLQVANLERNKKISSKGIRDLKDKHKGKVAYICGSSPSLEKNWRGLKRIKSGIVIALNASAQVLPTRIVDYFMSLDSRAPKEWVRKNMESVTAVLSPLVTTDVAKGRFKEVRWFSHNSKSLINDEIREALPDIGGLDVGLTITLSAAHFAYYLGCTTIVFVGQDFSFPENKIHINEKQKYDPSKNYMVRQSIKGEMIITSPTYYNSYRNVAGICFWLAINNIRIINATEDGILQMSWQYKDKAYKIEQRKLSDVISEFNRRGLDDTNTDYWQPGS